MGVVGASSASCADMFERRPFAGAGVEGDRAVANQAFADPEVASPLEGGVGAGDLVERSGEVHDDPGPLQCSGARETPDAASCGGML